MQRNPKVLLVDDDCALRQLITEVLTPQGFDVFEAGDGAAMRDILEKNVVDVIVLDIMMPNEDGLSIARSLHDRRDLRIIMVSALGSETDRIVGLEVGADDYLVKPISPRELIARIRAVLRRNQSASEEGGAMNAYLFAGWRLDPVRRLLRDTQKA
jgi:two-component system, OmpR family, response regulator